MALHFSQEEFDRRKAATMAKMSDQKLDAMLLFAQESMYWLSGYDTFGYCFFQCLVLQKNGEMTLLTRSADLRQAQLTSNIEDIRTWVDRGNASPAIQLREMLDDLGLLGATFGIEYDTHGLTAANGRALDEALRTFADCKDASNLIPPLRAIKSVDELAYVRIAGELSDLALTEALPLITAGADEGKILATMQGVIFEGGGDYPANEFIMGSGPDALLCRYKAGRRKLDSQDQITLEWAAAYRHYHVPMMRTVIVGQPTTRHEKLFETAKEALNAVEEAMRQGNTFGDVFDAHAGVVDAAGEQAHRLNACGYSVGARFSPSWMEWPMFYRNNDAVISPNMTLFTHMILMDSDNNIAMCPGHSYITTESAPEPLSKLPIEMLVKK
ncbi:M24 family metallopeptidase [Cohaesibacter gelatinilyticus]|uniref:Xaa-Pro dipeptidase n=1 Tax=Cohaesibacter gelatinilyticus TaxID=372072 RepID=A0A285PI09_9HYPH|nr:Xaa-Pro peptidase family protein [Cohaesibacter gelatinilyticus]SNZ20877.1 Xaa-Pro dipeptidase [Cohaesibacter gelatinilyticus]HAT85066.1 aminopeptidase P family protein [Hyphomicrobiales bacterium]